MATAILSSGRTIHGTMVEQDRPRAGGWSALITRSSSSATDGVSRAGGGLVAVVLRRADQLGHLVAEGNCRQAARLEEAWAAAD